MVPFYPNDLLFGTGRSIGICTLWTPKDRYKSQLRYVYIIGNLYSKFGLAILIRNILAVPSIQHIVITGKDNPDRERWQAENLLKGNIIASELYLEDWHIEEFYTRVKLHDARQIGVRDQTFLTQFILGLPTIPQLHKSIIVPLPEIKQEIYPTSRSGHIIRANSIISGHIRLLQEINTFGELEGPDTEGHYRRTLWQLMVCLSSKTNWRNSPFYNEAEIKKYGQAFLEGHNENDFSYEYGQIIREEYGDQIQSVLDVWKKNKNSYRTVISLWGKDTIVMKDPPCITVIHPRIRGNVLDMFAYIRSNEMFKAWPMNVAGLRYLQEYLSEKTKSEMGELTITSGSAVLFDYDFTAVKSYLSSQILYNIQHDPKGDWKLFYNNDCFYAEHYYNGILLQKFEERSIRRLERRILPFITDVSHAIYIGKTLANIESQANNTKKKDEEIVDDE